MRAAHMFMLCLVLYLGLSTSTAQARFQSIGDGEGWLIGGAVDTESQRYKQADALSVSLQPYIAYEWENLHIGVDDVSYDFFATSALSLTLMVEPRWSPADEEDSPIFAGLDRDDAIEAGIALDYVLVEDLVSQWYWQSHYFQDVSSVYKGEYATTELGYQREYAHHTLDVSFGLSHQSAELNQYLYGVSLSEKNSNRPAFNAKSSVHSFVEFGINYQFMNRSLLVTKLNIDMLDDDLKKSPLLEDTFQVSVLFGWVKIF